MRDIVRLQVNDGMRNVCGNILHTFHMLHFPKRFYSEKELKFHSSFITRGVKNKIITALSADKIDWNAITNRCEMMCGEDGLLWKCLNYMNCNLPIKRIFEYIGIYDDLTNSIFVHMIHYSCMMDFPYSQYLIMRAYYNGYINFVNCDTTPIWGNNTLARFIQKSHNKRHTIRYLKAYMDTYDDDENFCGIVCSNTVSTIPNKLFYCIFELAVYGYGIDIWSYANDIRLISIKRFKQLLRRNIIDRSFIQKVLDMLSKESRKIRHYEYNNQLAALIA